MNNINEIFQNPINTIGYIQRNPKMEKLLNKLGIFTIYDLINYYPRRYIDYTNPVKLANVATDETVLIRATLIRKLSSSMTSRVMIFKVLLNDGEDDIVGIIYGQKYLFDSLQADTEYCVIGKVTNKLIRPEMNISSIVPADGDELMTPVYPLTRGITSNQIKVCVKNALSLTDKFIYEPMPREIIQKNGLVSMPYAIKNIHFPTDSEAMQKARKRLAFDEIFNLHLSLLTLKKANKIQTPCVMNQNVCNISELFNLFSFELTNAQKNAINDCLQDMCSQSPARRLVQGDVGSGKTAVAIACCYFATKNNYQSALMAPTEILATQHYETFSSLLCPFGVNVELLTGSLTAKEKRELKKRIKNGEVDVVVGTHAIIQKDTEFSNLGLIITDEQHRFGVNQRSTLASKGNNPHTIVMSATPIPRTLGLIMHGDLDVSIINELPKGRQPIQTMAITGKIRTRAYNFVRKNVLEGRQAYIVCAAIDGTEDIKGVTEFKEYIQQAYFKDLKVEILHGAMKADQKDSIMEDFKNKKIDILVSTTVIEVGIDVPNASIIVIEDAERFGLSQLHQLRGRVGRGQYASYCVLITDHPTKDAVTRLNTLCENTDGFKIAEEDLQLRGPGNYFGDEQHGFPTLKIADLSQDMEIFKSAQQAAMEVFNRYTIQEIQRDFPQVFHQLND